MSNYFRAQTREKPPSLNKERADRRTKYQRGEGDAVTVSPAWQQQHSNCLSPASLGVTWVVQCVVIAASDWSKNPLTWWWLVTRAGHLPICPLSLIPDYLIAKQKWFTVAVSLHTGVSPLQKKIHDKLSHNFQTKWGNTKIWVQGKSISLDGVQNAKFTFVFVDLFVSIRYQFTAWFIPLAKKHNDGNMSLNPVFCPSK